ncbi:hypothetical protein HGO37_14105 [Rhizobium sp. CG4]|jgi:hypothetical protein|uniref:hypothetical protein n=1 Tax=Rhizobium sp. CG4 TaxID=2726075 RepID=UPI002033F8A6|nr:hypothetical protein [Rhizobium sp. CG4]MCM2456520.1 hypothetical protein [Rhizobium sp. CG4]
MRRLPFPDFDDIAGVDALVDNTRLGSYPDLQAFRQALKDGYEQYHNAEGNAQAVLLVPIPDPSGDWLRKHYKNPPTSHLPINDIREDGLALPCSMCGSSHAFSLDHVLPKEDHPAFAIFSRNLVPACYCNLKRGRNYRGNNVGARTLHPYYDACMDERLYAAQFSGMGKTARVGLQILVADIHPEKTAIAFHLDNIVKPTGVLNWMRKRWVKFVRAPRKIVGSLDFIPANDQELFAAIRDHRDGRDYAQGSPNNWESMFAEGLLDPTVIAWLLPRLSADGRGIDDPVIAGLT